MRKDRSQIFFDRRRKLGKILAGQIKDKIIHQGAKRLDHIIGKAERVLDIVVMKTDGWMQSARDQTSRHAGANDGIAVIERRVYGIVGMSPKVTGPKSFCQ